jgi:ribosomal protein L11 methyltransferase
VTKLPTYRARLTADEPAARRIADLLAECLDPVEAVSSAFAGPDGRWQVEVHFPKRPSAAQLRPLIALSGGEHAARTLMVEKIAPRDWVKHSLIGLRPVEAGRFVVHGAHDRDRVPSNCIAIEIEAGQAFGTGHHGTTRGCLIALDMLARRHRPRHILDLGTGTGVLAIAAAKVLRAPVLATDIDRNAVRIAHDNAQRNHVGALVTTAQAAGLQAREIALRAPFELVLANILLAPLRRLAAPIARALSPGAHVVLSGLLASHAGAAIAAYRTQGVVLERCIVCDGWATLIMLAASRYRG